MDAIENIIVQDSDVLALAGGYEFLHHRLQGDGTKLAHGLAAVEPRDVPQRMHDVRILTRCSVVLLVIALGESQISDDQLVDAEVGRLGLVVCKLAPELPALLQPFAN